MSINCDDESIGNLIINIYLLRRILGNLSRTWCAFYWQWVDYFSYCLWAVDWTYFGLWQASRLLHIDWNIGGSRPIGPLGTQPTNCRRCGTNENPISAPRFHVALTARPKVAFIKANTPWATHKKKRTKRRREPCPRISCVNAAT